MIKDVWVNQSTNFKLTARELTEFPSCIGHLTQLKELNMYLNKFTNIPDVIGDLTQLECLNLNNNKLTSLPNAIGRLTKLKSLDLSWNCFTNIPDVIGDLTQLESLNLSVNKLTSVPNIIGRLTKLKSLDLSWNCLTNMPDEIRNLTCLQRLNLEGNKATSFPKAILHLTQLQELIFTTNALSSLPDAIAQLTQLKKLHLLGNRLATLPDTIGQMTLLEQLRLRNNNLITLPVTLGNLTNLESIDITINRRLKELPMSLGQLPRITYLDTESTGIPQEQVQAVLAACKALRNRTSYLISHLKLWLKTGEKAIDPNEFLKQLTEEQQMTLNEWLIRLEKTKDFKYNDSWIFIYNHKKDRSIPFHVSLAANCQSNKLYKKEIREDNIGAYTQQIIKITKPLIIEEMKAHNYGQEIQQLLLSTITKNANEIAIKIDTQGFEMSANLLEDRLTCACKNNNIAIDSHLLKSISEKVIKKTISDPVDYHKIFPMYDQSIRIELKSFFTNAFFRFSVTSEKQKKFLTLVQTDEKEKKLKKILDHPNFQYIVHSVNQKLSEDVFNAFSHGIEELIKKNIIHSDDLFDAEKRLNILTLFVASLDWKQEHFDSLSQILKEITINIQEDDENFLQKEICINELQNVFCFLNKL